MTTTIRYKGTEIPLEINYHTAMFVFPKLGLRLLNLLQDSQTVLQIMGDDDTMIKIWYHYVHEYAGPLEDAVKELNSETMNDFRDKFWREVVNFTNPQMRPLAKEMWKMTRDQLQKPEKLLQDISSNSSSSTSSPNHTDSSTQADTHSES